MDKGILFGAATSLVFGCLPYAIKSMPPFISWSGIAAGIAIGAIAMLPTRFQPSSLQAIMYVASIALFVAAATWQASSLSPTAAADELTSTKGPRLNMGGEKSDAEEKSGLIVGTDIDNSGGGVGIEINSSGNNGAPSVGGESIVHVPAGQSAIGTRIIQRGPGTGLKVIQNGPGVGFRSVVIVGSPDTKSNSSNNPDK